MSYTATNTNNKEILEHNLKVIDGDLQLWDVFLLHAAVKPLKWVSFANEHLGRIDIEDKMWYVFTYPYPGHPFLISSMNIFSESLERKWGARYGK